MDPVVKIYAYGLLTKREDGWILAKFFFLRVYVTARGQYQAILTEKAWSIRDYYHYFLVGHNR